ncbi:hypothetical protein [Bradyrhizobium japonicum]|uniref:hypothetical protein n=1 Tax=Bradyrhizobium japonicum TaxID=375 RepID=UPI0012BC4A93|nr:hypothetical protein [Bradyrhizobium japonicum]
MKQFDNDNDPFTFTTLGAATLNVVRWLEQDRQKPAAGDQDQAPGNEIDKQREHDRFVETRLREIERFERRYLRNRP